MMTTAPESVGQAIIDLTNREAELHIFALRVLEDERCPPDVRDEAAAILDRKLDANRGG